MKRYLIALVTLLATLTAGAQTKGIKIAYIDMEYILDKVPDFAEAKSQLEQKANKWKQEMDVKRNEIAKLKESLQAEKALLTRELIDERDEEILALEKELIDYQEKKFGPKGDLITQKAVLVKPIQDQVFTIVQDLAEIRKYDFVFDKSSDLTMLFSAKKHDISDLVVKRLTSTAKREKLNSKQVKKLEEQEKKEETESDPNYVDRLKAQEEKKEARQKMIDDRKAAALAKRQAAIDKRDQMKADRAAQAAGGKAKAPSAAAAKTQDADAGNGNDIGGDDDDATPVATNKAAAPKTAGKGAAKTTDKATTTDGDDDAPDAAPKPTAADKAAEAADKAADAKQAIADKQAAAKAERERKLEERKKAVEDRKREIEAQREAAKKAREDKQKAAQQGTNGTGTAPAQGNPSSPTDGND